MAAAVEVPAGFLGLVKVMLTQFPGDESRHTGRIQLRKGATTPSGHHGDSTQCFWAAFDRCNATWKQGLKSISQLVPALGIEGNLMIVAAPFEPLEIGAIDLISMTRRVQGWPSGTATDSTDAVAFAHRNGVRPMIERFPLDEAQAAFERMMSGEVRFRAVLDIVPD